MMRFLCVRLCVSWVCVIHFRWVFSLPYLSYGKMRRKLKISFDLGSSVEGKIRKWIIYNIWFLGVNFGSEFVDFLFALSIFFHSTLVVYDGYAARSILLQRNKKISAWNLTNSTKVCSSIFNRNIFLNWILSHLVPIQNITSDSSPTEM